MKNLTIRSFKVTDEQKVIQLWEQCGLLVSWNNPKEDIQRKLSDSPDMFIIGEIKGEIVASCMFGYDGHRGWYTILLLNLNYKEKG